MLDSNNYDYLNRTLDALENTLSADVVKLLGFESVQKEFPVSEEYIAAANLPALFLDIQEGESYTNKLGVRVIEVVPKLLIIYAQKEVGWHFEDTGQTMAKQHASLLDHYLYHLPRYEKFTKKLMDNVEGFNQLLDVDGIEWVIDRAGPRNFMMIQGTMSIELDIHCFDYVALLDSNT